MAPHEEAVGEETGLLLSDGRILSYAEYGEPSGAPVLFFHGFPGSHKEAALWHDSAVRHSVRLIAPDRPGIGFSSYQPERHFLDWPADISALTRQLGLVGRDCRILAVAGGSPYALACLHEQSTTSKHDLPRFQGTAIVSGIYPLSLGSTGIKLSTRITLWIVGYLWFLLIPLLDWLMGKPARTDPELFKTRLLKEAEGRPFVDRKCLADNKEFADGFIESARHSFAQDSRGAAYEAGLMGRAWGFDLQSIVGKNLTMWQGGFDDACPVPLARRAQDKLTGSALKVFEYEGHLTIWARRQDVIWEALLDSDVR
ncbi:hydrolase [Verticillium dahliae VdLs.17]|uniref:Hydrolase n=1 Tax=Verticillium dahliae (strain VdLs.17 / ATCC MYA-4575 / FGSC 10137) TaxID=498257 RepID=G2XCP4_VERDV|nr:hydrolase [Verticillium dahliae VdLs.17]EGY16762.1 hydrolase [Verticillium dahliae VdLs.17]KAF3345524.1 putative transporter [Verticillium dahliae VDG2]KAH6706869.1 hydrolase [Verticillium dahliae]